MKKIVLLSALLCLVFAYSNAQPEISDTGDVLYVKAGSNGDGMTWGTAFGNMQDALRIIKPGQQVWVSAGTYYPSTTNNRTESFIIPSDVQVYGGFAGYETQLKQRNWEQNLTILSGEIGTNDSDDNSYTVVYTEGVSSSTVIDGFAITGGTANGVNSLGDIQRCGAGWYNNGSDGTSNPTIINCLFMNNYGRDGAALYNFAENGRCIPKLINCQFVANKADLDGGAIFNDGRQGFTMLEVDHCLFSGNSANFGAGINNHADNNGESRLILKNSVFEGNISYVRNTINDNELTGGSYDLIKQACRFTDNVTVVGDNNADNSSAPQGQPRNTYKKVNKISYLRY